MSIFSTALLIFGVSQLYWAWRAYTFLATRVRSRARLWALCAALAALFLVEYQFNFGAWREGATPVHLRLADALLGAPFLWWAASSFFAFLIVLLFAIPRGIRKAIRAARRREKPEIESPARRDLLQRTATVAASTPFVAGAYGLLYGRLNLDIAPRTIHLPRLPRAFEGFRIAQLSDIHIGPYMPAEEIRKYVAIANAQKADMVVLTGDFVTFDPATQQPVVDALRGLRAPYGVFGSLGNHDAWAGVEWTPSLSCSVQVGVRILRAENVAIEARRRRSDQPDRRGFLRARGALALRPPCRMCLRISNRSLTRTA